MKILLIAAQPYRPSGNARSVATYFSAFEPNEIVQVFSDARVPLKGFASSYFQITDKRLLKRRFKKQKDVIFSRQDLSETEGKDNVNRRPPFKRRGGFYRLLRGAIWKKKFWDTEALETFVDDFGPDLVYVCWGPDFWQMDMAIHFASKRKLPVVVSIMDDCFAHFGGKGLFTRKYERRFRETFGKLLSLNPKGIFISEKIREKYRLEFNLQGIAIPVASSRSLGSPEVTRFCQEPFVYFGTLESGRGETLFAFSQALEKAGKKEKVIVYSKDYAEFEKRYEGPNITWLPPVPYDQLPVLEEEAGALISCEGFSKKNIDAVRYSLSTKIGDCLRSGKVLLSIGPIGAGSVDFLREKEAALCCTSLGEMDQFVEYIYSKTEEELLNLVKKELEIGEEFDLESNAKKCKEYLVNLIERH